MYVIFIKTKKKNGLNFDLLICQGDGLVLLQQPSVKYPTPQFNSVVQVDGHVFGSDRRTNCVLQNGILHNRSFLSVVLVTERLISITLWVQTSYIIIVIINERKNIAGLGKPVSGS